MYSQDWRNICEPEAAALVDAQQFYAVSAVSSHSPIDDYYEYVEHLLTLGGPSELSASPTLGRLLLLGLVAGVERYVRSIMAGLVQLCPVARNACSDQQITFGSLDFYRSEDVGYALFDASSLAGGDEIRKKTRSVLGIEIIKGTSIDSALDEFDKLCHLRHASVHSRGTLGRRNMVALGSSNNRNVNYSVSVSFADLQRAGVACHSFARSYNRLLFAKTVERWRSKQIFSADWNLDRDVYTPLFDMFRSKRDVGVPRSAYDSYRHVKRAIL